MNKIYMLTITLFNDEKYAFQVEFSGEPDEYI